ncbi:MAG TPA: hypothetical protein VJV03_00010 [Pyrinomonadaceae bacterium]|nr:hypothetical protein [Pyrinomonadaceae bacterium]
MSVCRNVCATLLLLILWASFNSSAVAQESGDSAPATTRQSSETVSKDGSDLDTQLYLLVATNQDVDDGKMPAALEPVVKRLRASLPFKNYRLAATLINRVKNDGRLNLKWIGGPLMGAPVAATANITPSFNEFRVNNVKLVTVAGQQIVRMEGFGFGARIPIQTATLVAANAPAGPVINYESTGLNTDISMRESEPVIVGTLNVGPSGDAIILVMSASRAQK